MLTLYMSEILGPNTALVSSVGTPSPIPFPTITFADILETEMFIVDGVGGYSTASGASGSTVTVSIGLLNAAEWSNSNWTAISNPNGWSGLISPDGDVLYALFQGRDEMTLKVQVKITDAAGNPRTYLSMPVTILNSMAPSGTVASIKDGQFSIPSGVDSVDVTGLGLQAVPRRVFANVKKPDDGINLFATVREDSITADGFTVDFNGQTDSAGYTLDYILIFG